MILPDHLVVPIHLPMNQVSAVADALNQARIRSFGYVLSPVTSSAQDDSTSELLRFL